MQRESRLFEAGGGYGTATLLLLRLEDLAQDFQCFFCNAPGELIVESLIPVRPEALVAARFRSATWARDDAKGFLENRLALLVNAPGVAGPARHAVEDDERRLDGRPCPVERARNIISLYA